MTNASTNTISLSLGTANSLDGITCKAGAYNLSYLDQNGVKFGNFNGIKIGEDGLVTASFDNGQSLYIYKIPLAAFANPNSMDSLSGDVFSQNRASGTYLLKTAGSGGMGGIASQQLEASNVDLATEFSNMIIAQRAFSANAKVISTADEMLSILETIKR